MRLRNGFARVDSRAAQRNELLDIHLQLTQAILRGPGDAGPTTDAWLAARRDSLARYFDVSTEIRAMHSPDFAISSLALSELRAAVPTGQAAPD